MFEINATLAIFVLLFLLFMLALRAVFLKPVGRTIELRAKRIADDYAASAEARHEAEQIVGGYQQHLQEIRAQARKIVSESVQSAQKKRDDRVHQVQEQGRTKLEEAKQILAQDRGRLLNDLIEQETELVRSILEKLVGSSSAAPSDPATIRRHLEEAS
jgi:F-type H+-transporting ATPase subunit b